MPSACWPSTAPASASQFLILWAQGCCPQPATAARAELATRLQHRGQLYDQHQLAGLPGEASLSYSSQMVGLHHPELRLRRHRPPSPPPCFAASPASRPPTRQLLAGSGAFLSLRAAADGADPGAAAGLAGVPQSLSAACRLHGPGRAEQLPLGPAASQIAIKQLGSNGGGFFGINSAIRSRTPPPSPTGWRWSSDLIP